MTWAPKETQTKIYELLGNDATLVALLGGTVIGSGPAFGEPKIYDWVPDNTAYPYLTIDILPFDNRGNHTKEGWRCEFQINVWYREPGRGKLKVQDIQNRIDVLLHNANLGGTGWDTLCLLRTLVDILTEDDNVTLHGIQRFNLLLGEV